MNLLEALWVSAAAPNVKQSWLLNTLTPPPSWAENTGFTVCCSGGFHPGTFWCLSWCLSTSHTITGTNYERCFALIILFGSRWGVQSRVKSWLVHQAAHRYRMFWEARGRRKGGMKRWASRPKSAESQCCHGNPAARCSGEVLEHGVHFGEAESDFMNLGSIALLIWWRRKSDRLGLKWQPLTAEREQPRMNTLKP